MNLEFDSEILDLVRQKGFCCYECMHNFDETLPDKNEIYISLNGTGISDKDHQDNIKVWNKFEMRRMKEYVSLHLKYNILGSYRVILFSRGTN